MSDVRLMLGDCLLRMGEIADGSVDLILCDLPYGTTQCSWDVVIPFAPLWEHYRRVVKRNGAIVLTASGIFEAALKMSNPAMFKYDWVWDKGGGTGFQRANQEPMRCHEYVLVFYAAPPTYNPQKWRGRPNQARRTTAGFHSDVSGGVRRQIASDTSGMKYPRSVISGIEKHPKHARLHPNQKPVALMSYLIRTYTNPGEVVLDNCFGSGATGVACVQTGRRFVGIEKDPIYFQTGERRIHDASLQQRMTFEEVS